MLGSRHYLIMQQIKATIENDADLASGRTWRVRKKPYNRGVTWEPGGYISPMLGSTPYTENQKDELIYRSRVTIVDPADGALNESLETHLGLIERIGEIFRNKSGVFLPNSMGTALNALFAAATTAHKFASTTVEIIKVENDSLFVDPAFEKNYDASSCIVAVHVQCSRYQATSL